MQIIFRRLNSILIKQFTIYQILSYMYERFSFLIPGGVGELGLNFKKEFEMGKGMLVLRNK